MSNKEVANPLAMFGIQAAELATVPSFAQADAGMGNENVNAEDQSTVTLSLLQPMSPDVIDSDGRIAPGSWMNSITKETFKELYVANIFFKKQYSLFYKRAAAKKGLVDSFDTLAEANACVGAHPDKHDIELIENGIHYVVALGADGVAFPARIYFKATSLPVSRDWNSQLEAVNKGNARFISVWKLGNKKRENDKGKWWVPAIEYAGMIGDEELYKNIRVIYEGVRDALAPQVSDAVKLAAPAAGKA